MQRDVSKKMLCLQGEEPQQEPALTLDSSSCSMGNKFVI